MSDITLSYIVVDESFLLDFTIMGKNVSYIENKIVVNMSLKKINGDSSSSNYKVGNIVQQYRPNSQIHYIYTYCENTPQNHIVNATCRDIDVGNSETNIIIEANGDMFIRPESIYKNGSITTLNMSYSV